MTTCRARPHTDRNGGGGASTEAEREVPNLREGTAPAHGGGSGLRPGGGLSPFPDTGGGHTTAGQRCGENGKILFDSPPATPTL